MKTADFDFDLPEGLIAQYPPEERGASRLMVLDRRTGRREHRMTRELPSILEKGTLLVFNDSRVRKARLPAVSKHTGARTEFLLLNRVEMNRPDQSIDGRGGAVWRVMVQRAKRRRAGSRYVFEDGSEGEIIAADGEYRVLRFDTPIDDEWLDLHGHIPLPPYIRREDAPADSERYQTVYASAIGSAAAPTAGLHFTGDMLEALERAGLETAFITLHVGLGTFLPVRAENLEDHVMHEEFYRISDETASRVERAKAEGRAVLAVGTTSVRTLESAWQDGRLLRGEGATSMFIYPGYSFKLVDRLFTNFHTPGSTLLMLTAAFAGAKAVAFAGRDLILESYAEAVREGYRFFSYGDAMLIR
jgi:S-adenosylmethionine:tRNA ribosyltransferase-isomerase